MSERRTVRYTLSEIPEDGTDWDRLNRMTEEEIEANAASDPDNPLWTEEQLNGAALVLPGEQVKVPISLRLDPEVIDFFKAQGRGYQSRINAVLRAYVRTQQNGERRRA